MNVTSSWKWCAPLRRDATDSAFEQNCKTAYTSSHRPPGCHQCTFDTYSTCHRIIRYNLPQPRIELTLTFISFHLVWAIHPMMTTSIQLRQRQVRDSGWDQAASIKFGRLCFSDESIAVCSPRRSPSGSTRPCVAAVLTSGMHGLQSPPP